MSSGPSKVPCIALDALVIPAASEPTPEPKDATMRSELGTGVGAGFKRSEPEKLENHTCLDTDTELSDTKRINRRSDTDLPSSGSKGKKVGKKKKPNPSHAAQHNERQKEIQDKAKSLLEAAMEAARGKGESSSIPAKASEE